MPTVVPYVPQNITVHLGTPSSNAANVTVPFADFVDIMAKLGKDDGLEIHTMHEDIFNTMHKI